MLDAEKIGYFLGRLVREGKEDKDKEKENELESLKKGFEKLFGELENELKGSVFQFQAELGEKLVTKSKCPIYKYYSKWCDTECLNFAKGFAKAFGDIQVIRTSKQPESEYCIFEFKGV